jgi:hypothetical protein
VGVVLILIGVIALAYQGTTYTTHKTVLDLDPIQATKKDASIAAGPKVATRKPPWMPPFERRW